ncbi:MAG: hypothetical protein K2G47_03835 [Muribaculum sp.]|nr:hypothetical protein [Muribaculum sp.]
METNPTTTVTDEALKAAVEEAEQRGYLRGLNEAASSRMDEPAPFETIPSPGATAPPDSVNDDNPSIDCDFIAVPRRSIWD